MKRNFLMLILAGLIVASLTACESSAPGGDAATPAPEAEATLMTDDEADADSSLDTLILSLKPFLDRGGNTYDLYVENNGIVVSIWTEGVGNVLSTDIKSGSPEENASWENIKENLVKLDDGIREKVTSLGYRDTPVTLQFVNDTNHKEVFIASSNGEIVYDAFENSESKNAPDDEEDADSLLDTLVLNLKPFLNRVHDNYDVYVENDGIIVSIWTEGVGNVLSAYIKSGSPEKNATWESIKENLVKLDNSIREKVTSLGYGDTPVTLQFVNDTNHKEVFIASSNGEIVYDAFENPEPQSVNGDAQETTSIQTETVTMGQANALSSAKEYLSIMAFSRSGLIEQLEYEGFTTDEATYGVDHCDADWNEQAAKSAEQYLDIMSFSRQGLVDQLIHDGFTTDEATYGVDHCNADWNEQAAKSAKQYLDIMSFSRQGLVDQLKHDGFTSQQAEYGVSAAGY